MNKIITTSATLRRVVGIVTLMYSAVVMAHDAPGGDYPTAAKADYVFGCMKVNGESRPILESCSCSIDYIAQRMPYEEYVKVETVMQTSLDNGTRGTMLRELKWAKDLLDQFKKLQLKSDVECF